MCCLFLNISKLSFFCLLSKSTTVGKVIHMSCTANLLCIYDHLTTLSMLWFWWWCYFDVILSFSLCLFIFLTCTHWVYPLHPSALCLVQPNCWWDAERQDCVPCHCSPYGSISQRCDVEGRCICRPGFVGRRCDLRRQGYERRETRRPVERIPIEAVQQRWGGSSRTGGCPRGAYRPQAGVTHAACCALRAAVCVHGMYVNIMHVCIDVLCGIRTGLKLRLYIVFVFAMMIWGLNVKRISNRNMHILCVWVLLAWLLAVMQYNFWAYPKIFSTFTWMKREKKYY